MDHPHATVFQKTIQEVTGPRPVFATITTRPGVYLYYDTKGTVIYVGKAKNLRNRVRQYFACDDAIGQKTNLLVSQITSIKAIPTDSEFDALLLEATLIRKYQPKYNSVAKDDKSPLYIAITFDEPLPRIVFTRKTIIDSWSPFPKRRFIAGPFQSGRVARRLMQSVRKIIPYCTQQHRDGHPCFYTHIGLCNPCPSTIRTKKLASVYRSNLQKIALLLSGRARRVRVILEKKMHECGDHMAFEEAGEYKKQLDVLNMLLTHSFDPGIFTDKTSDRLTDLSRILHLPAIHRIECIDISTLQGEWATGSLVVFTNGIPDTNEYRRFRIKTVGKSNDVGMMAEVIKRRFAHPEWPKPDLLVVDGGKAQVSTATGIIRDIPIIGLAKRYEEIVVPNGHAFKLVRLSPASPALQLVQHIRDEAHRFAKRYHTILRAKFDRS